MLIGQVRTNDFGQKNRLVFPQGLCQNLVNDFPWAWGPPIDMKMGLSLCVYADGAWTAKVDEATGYQYDRASDALRVKLRAYLAEEMRDWEKTFPDDLWQEFGRLTNWKGSVTQRPKYWGHLVTELVYTYLDADVCKWLKDNKPQPQHGEIGING